MKVDDEGNKVYRTSEGVRKKVLAYYHANREAILKRRRELKKLNKEQQDRNRQRWARLNRKRLRAHQKTFAEKRKAGKNAPTGTI